MTQRPVVQAKVVETSGFTPMSAPPPPPSSTPHAGQLFKNSPIQMSSGRLPDGGHGANGMMKPKSIFENNGGSQLGRAQMQQNVPARRPLVMARAVLGQDGDAVKAAPPAPPQPPTNVQQVLKREAGPVGLTKKEAADIAVALGAGIDASALGLQAGLTCVGVDGPSLQDARTLQAGIAEFSISGGSNERLDLKDKEIELIDRVLECATIYGQYESNKNGKLIAFVAGGLAIGALVYWISRP